MNSERNKIHIRITVNGLPYELDIDPRETLLSLIRDRLNLTGTKKCCGEGECGACTVMMNGRTVNSCLVLAAEAEGAEILTIEGLSPDGEPGKLQQAFLDEGAVQCGFCTPGMVLSAHYLLLNNPNPSSEDVQEGLEGNLCRCTGYARIETAVLKAAAAFREEKAESIDGSKT